MIITIQNGTEQFSSLQVGDTIYYNSFQLVLDEEGNEYKQTVGDPISVGIISSISSSTGSVTINNPNALEIPENSFLFFTKPANKANVKGYYMSVKMENKKTTRAELFGVSANIIESSK
jgi:hypothetical protein